MKPRRLTSMFMPTVSQATMRICTAIAVLTLTVGCVSTRSDVVGRFQHEDLPQDIGEAVRMRSFHLTYILENLSIDADSVGSAVLQLNEAGRGLQHG